MALIIHAAMVPHSIWIGSADFAGRTSVTNRKADIQNKQSKHPSYIKASVAVASI